MLLVRNYVQAWPTGADGIRAGYARDTRGSDMARRRRWTACCAT
jgi:hypothetical protein